MPFQKGHKINVGREVSEYTRRKISKSLTGHLISEETKQKISESEKKAGRIISPELRLKLTEGKKGIVFTDEHRKNLSQSLRGRSGYWQGKKMSDEHRRKLGMGKIGLPSWCKGKKVPQTTGERNPNWKGGITPHNVKVRNSPEYRNWRTSVFKRDSYTCQECGQIGRELNADHIKPFALFPELRLELSNGRTLCLECHKKTPTYLRKAQLYVKN